VLSLSLGVGLAACDGGKHVEETETATITVSRGDSDEAIAITVTPKTPESNDSPDITPTMTCTATLTPTPPVRSNENWEGIVNVLWYEGASSFPDRDEARVLKKLYGHYGQRENMICHYMEKHTAR
jgi:hypothetical protein